MTITIVIPWYGPDTAGGAEAQARALAGALAAQGAAVEVWTTDGRDSYAPPVAYYPAGAGELDGILVRRFPIEPPHTTIHIPPAIRRTAADTPWSVFPEHELRLLASLPSSDALLDAVLAERSTRRYIFLPYPFPTTFWGMQLAGDRGVLLPCLHDEPYARYSTYRALFAQAHTILANSAGERAFALQLYGLGPARVVLAGEGIDLSPVGDGARFRAARGLHGPLLYCSGVRAGKNAELLIRYTREYWARRGRPLTLLLSGREVPPIPAALAPLVQDLGYLSVQEKHDAYAAVDLFINPSTIESFSIVLMEAWLQGTPALVNAACDVTRTAAVESGGGVSFASFGEFCAALDLLLPDAPLRRELGARGRQWVRANCRWDNVAARTIAAIG